MNIPTLSVVVSALKTVPPTPTSKDVLTVKEESSKLPSMITSLSNFASSANDDFP